MQMYRFTQAASGKSMLKSIWQLAGSSTKIIGRVQTGRTGLGWGSTCVVQGQQEREDVTGSNNW